MKSKTLLAILEDEKDIYLGALEGCDEPEWTHYQVMYSSISALIVVINSMHKECKSD